MPWTVTKKSGEPVDHLSASSLARFITCPENWRQHYLLEAPEPGNPYLIWGSAHHETLRRAFEPALEGKPSLTPTFAGLMFDDILTGIMDESPPIEWGKVNEEEMRHVGALMVATYVRAYRDARVAALELPFELQPVREGHPPVVGTIDMITENCVVDYKTAQRCPSKPKSEWLLQAFIYQLHTPMNFEWHVCLKNINPAVRVLNLAYLDERAPLTRQWIGQTTDRIQSLYDEYGVDNPWPGDGLHLDSCWKCDFSLTCEWRKGL